MASSTVIMLESLAIDAPWPLLLGRPLVSVPLYDPLDAGAWRDEERHSATGLAKVAHRLRTPQPRASGSRLPSRRTLR